MRQQRQDLYRQLEQLRGSKLIVYVTGTRQGLETQIANDILPRFTEHLDKIDHAEKITLLLYTNGGNTLTAWSLVNLIRSYCDEFEVIIPSNCFSSGTLICLGANNLIMTKQASLGPIDPSVNGPLNPQIPGVADPNAKVPVSVEYVKAYLEMVRKDFGITSQAYMKDIVTQLAEKIHPLTLGQVYRSKTQIQMLARKLLKWQNLSKQKENEIINFLCSESGSHDYSIRRNEAKDSLGLNIEKPDNNLYAIIKTLFCDISAELELESPYNPVLYLGTNQDRPYSFRRVLIESVSGGTDVFVSEGNLFRQSLPTGNSVINDSRLFEGWRHEN